MHELKPAVIAVIAATLVLGLAYPIAMTGASQLAYPHRADGESRLLARPYPRELFQPRPSQTDYAARATAFDNQGPNQRALAEQIKGYVARYLKREGRYTPGLEAADVPADAATTSASGVDPDISDANARIQANRVAALRGLDRARVLALIRAHSSRGIVNVNDLNAAVEAAR